VTQEQSNSLGQLRAELDIIDDAILDLIERRLAASLQVAAAKDAEGDGLLKLRPRRQAEILERLKGRARHAAPELVEEVWREIMAHSLQAQSPLEIVLAPSEQPELLEARARAHFGSAAPIRWAASTSHALRAAIAGEAVAILSEPLDQRQGEVRTFDVLTDDGGRAVAYAVARVAEADAFREPPARGKTSAASGASQRCVATASLWR
jgi:chorismate mutase